MLVPMLNSTIEADARVSLEEVEQVLGNIFSKEEKEECNTLSGLLVFLVGYIPSKNEVIRHKSGIEFKVLSVDPLKINKVCIYGYTK
jgi:CBS domain containing-hemolysin-like protein